MIFGWFQAQAVKLLGGLAAVLALALAFTLWRADSLSEQRDEAEKALVAEQVRHKVTAASLVALTGELEAFVAAGELREENRDKALDNVAKETKALRDQAEAFDILTVDGV